MVIRIKQEILGNQDYSALVPLFDGLLEYDKKDILLKSLDEALEVFVEGGTSDSNIEIIVEEYVRFFNLTKADLERDSLFDKVIKILTIKDLLNGELPNRFHINENELPINLMKDEHVIWMTACSYFEKVSGSMYLGFSQGISIRIAKGIYYRKSGFGGKKVETSVLKSMGAGVLFFTNKHLYYHSDAVSFRIKYDRIVSYYNYEDGIGIVQDGANKKPQVFRGIDGWFAYNLAKNICNLPK